MHRLGRLLTVVAAVPFPLLAWAATPGWYIALDGGQAQYANSKGAAAHWASMPLGSASGWTVLTSSAALDRRDTSDAGFRVAAGYRFNDYLALEAGYVNLGTVSASGSGGYSWSCNSPPGEVCVDIVGTGSYASHAQLQAHGWSMSAIGSWPISERWSLFAKLGAFDARAEFEASSAPTEPDPNVVPVSIHDTSTHWGPAYGVGVDYSALAHWAVRLGWERYAHFGDRDTSGKVNVNLLSLGVMYAF